MDNGIVVLGFTERDLDGIASLALAGKQKSQTDWQAVYDAFVAIGLSPSLAETEADKRTVRY
jgi:hypothetical protein